MSATAESLFQACRIPEREPAQYNESKALLICRRIAKGETLRAICDDPGMPDESTVRFWAQERPDFIPHYMRARVLQAHAWAEATVQIADDCAETHEAIGVARLQIEARKWFASKALPRVYGDKLPELSDPSARSLQYMSIGELEALVSNAQAALEKASTGVLEHKPD